MAYSSQTCRRLVILLTALVTLSFAASAYAQQSLLDKVKDRGSLRVAVTTGSPPLSFINKSHQFDGFDVDIAKLIAREMFGNDHSIKFVRTSFSGRWAAVNTGRVDFGIMATTIYLNRAMNVAFTEPVIDSGIALVVRKDSKVENLKGMNSGKFKVARLNVKSEAMLHDKYFPKAKSLVFDSQGAELQAVLSGQANALTVDLPIAKYWAKKNNNIKVLPGTIAGEYYNNAIFMKQGDFTWWLFLNTVVNELKHGSLYTQYDKIYEKWFGVHAPPQKSYTPYSESQ
jgi:polar amino acid transport system substrate-binding protein